VLGGGCFGFSGELISLCGKGYKDDVSTRKVTMRRKMINEKDKISLTKRERKRGRDAREGEAGGVVTGCKQIRQQHLLRRPATHNQHGQKKKLSEGN
jgi:hypothetical protein